MFVKPAARRFRPSRKATTVLVSIALLAAGGSVAAKATADTTSCTPAATTHEDPVKGTQYNERWCDVFRSADVSTHKDWSPALRTIGQVSVGRHWFLCQEQWKGTPNKATYNNPVGTTTTSTPAIGTQSGPTRVSAPDSADGSTVIDISNEAAQPSTAATAQPSTRGKKNTNDWWLLTEAKTVTNEAVGAEVKNYGWVPATHIRQGGQNQRIPGVPVCSASGTSTPRANSPASRPSQVPAPASARPTQAPAPTSARPTQAPASDRPAPVERMQPNDPNIDTPPAPGTTRIIDLPDNA